MSESRAPAPGTGGEFARHRPLNPLRVAAAWVLAIVYALVLTDLGMIACRVSLLSLNDESLRELVPASDVLYRMKPGYHPLHQFTINSMGFRGGEFQPRRAGVTRLLALGDSTVFGYGGTEEQSWVGVLEKTLSRIHPTEVLNLGRIASSSTGSLADLKKFGESLQPDGLLIGVGSWNDFQIFHEAPSLTEPEALRDGFFQRQMASANSFAMHSRWFRLARSLAWRQRQAADARTTEAWYASGMFSRGAAAKPRRVPLPLFERNLEEMWRWAQARHIPVFFLQPCLPPDVEEKNSIVLDYLDAVHRAAQRPGCYEVPSRAALLGLLKQRKRSEVWWDFVHLYPVGNAAIADAVAGAVSACAELPYRNPSLAANHRGIQNDLPPFPPSSRGNARLIRQVSLKTPLAGVQPGSGVVPGMGALRLREGSGIPSLSTTLRSSDPWDNSPKNSFLSPVFRAGTSTR